MACFTLENNAYCLPNVNAFLDTKKRHAECIVELYRHAGIFKSTIEIRSTSRSLFPSAYLRLNKVKVNFD